MTLGVYNRVIRDCKLVFWGSGVYFPLDVISFEVTYSINAIPTATVTVPLGREFFSGGISNAYATLNGFILSHTPAFLYFSVGIADPFPNKTTIANHNGIIFAGYMHNVREMVSGTDLVMVIELQHWLSDLTHSSTLSAMSHPSNPKDTIYDPLLTFDTGGGFLNYAPMGVGENLVNPHHAAEDFWRFGIVPFLAFLSGQERINTDLFLNPDNDAIGYLVKRALFSFGVSKLRINEFTTGSSYVEVVFSMIDKLWGITDQKASASFFDAHAKLNFWDKLVELSQDYFFAIVPFPLFYRAVPFTLGLADHWNPYAPDRPYIIPPDEILQFSLEVEKVKVPLRALGIYTGVRSYAGAALDKPEEASMNYIGGWFIQFPDPGFGLIQIVQPPDYLNLAYEPSAYTVAAAGGLYAPVSSIRSPAERMRGMLAQQHIIRNAKFNFLDHLARYYYVQTRMIGRKAQLVCPFRGDICPGSTIAFSTDDNSVFGSFVPASVDGGILFATVISVTYRASSSDPPTSTYTLLGVRSLPEFTNLNFSINYHPLYSNYFIGSPHLL